MRNPTSNHTIGGLLLLALIATGCSQSQDAAYVRDDVYDRPDPREITASIAGVEETKAAPAEEQIDYYNSEEAQQYANPRGYYDMTYNDPYYYGSDRYGFGMMYGSQWGNNSMWSSGYGYGNVWNDPFYGGYGGYGGCSGWNNGYYSGWGYGGGWNSGYGSSYYNGYGYGCGNSWYNPYYSGGYNGYGYYGYGGGCYSCYQPIVTCGGDGWNGGGYFGHRPSFGGGTNTGGTTTGAPVGTRVSNRDQIGLMKPTMERLHPPTNANSTRPAVRTVPTPRSEPAQQRERPAVRRERPVVQDRTQPRTNDGGNRTNDTGRSTNGGGGGGNNGGNNGNSRPPR